ncbi:hypothetical protein EV359DRAFT_77178 [Lentinula novae-zelandiae]|nr:hypothetical protein EV359DRAFT_77178 [Lentinula novae-zelandiae]
MSSADTTYQELWITRCQIPSPQYSGEVDTDLGYRYHAEVSTNDRLNLEDMSVDYHSSSDNHSPYFSPTVSYQASNSTGHQNLNSNMKPVPRLDTGIVDDMGHRHNSLSASTTSWSPSPSSMSIDTEVLYLRSQQYESPQSSTRFESSFINGFPCHCGTGPDDNDGRHLSEPDAFYLDNMIHSDPNALTCTTVSPQILGLSFEQELTPLNFFNDPVLIPQGKTQVATERVLAASRRRRGQLKPGGKLLHCHMCEATFTAKHNLTSKKPISQVFMIPQSIISQITLIHTGERGRIPVSATAHLAPNTYSKDIKRRAGYLRKTRIFYG